MKYSLISNYPIIKVDRLAADVLQNSRRAKCNVGWLMIKYIGLELAYSFANGKHGTPSLTNEKQGNFDQIHVGLGISDKKNNSAEDGIDGTNGYFRRNSGCSAEQKISEFRSEPFRGRENNSEFRSMEHK